MSKRVWIVTGYARAGTTYVTQLLNQCPEVQAVKLNEGSPLHPYRSADGLRVLAGAWNGDYVMIARCVRHPLDIVRSWYAVWEEEGRDSGQYVAQHDLLQATNVCARHMAAQVPCENVIDVRYEQLGDVERNNGLLDALSRLMPDPKASLESLKRHLRKTWRLPEAAVNEGALRYRTDDVLTEEETQKWREWLRETAEREGYDV